MRRKSIFLFVPLLALFAVGSAQAGFDNSHHDMRMYLGTAASIESCYHCHGRVDGTAFSDNSYGRVGQLCMGRCHGGTSVVFTPNAGSQPTPGPSVNDNNYGTLPDSSRIDALSLRISRPTGTAHGQLTSNLLNGVGGGAYTIVAPGSGWPYVSTGTLQCTSCHAVHDSANAPFVWAPLGPSAVATWDGFCDGCHKESARSGNAMTSAQVGPHPTNFIASQAAGQTARGAFTAGGRTATRRPRTIFIQQYGSGSNVPVFDVVSPAATSLTGQGYDVTRSWNMGGHLTTTTRNAGLTAWTTARTDAILGCFTCHAAHRTNVNGENNLVVVATLDNNTSWNPLCVGCHGNATTSGADRVDYMVGTSNWGHPVGSNTGRDGNSQYTSSVGNFKFRIAAVTYTNGQTGNQLGQTNYEVMCTSCHKVHGGVAGFMAIMNIGQTGTNAICKQCHSGVGIPNLQDWSKNGSSVNTGHNLPNTHHVTSGAVSNGMGKTNDTGTLLTVSNPSWAAGRTDGLGTILGSTMDCADCHVFNGTAHNW